MTAARAPRHEVHVGCVLAREVGVLVVLTDDGPVRASYGCQMLREIAQDRSCLPEPGEWVTVRQWYDGPVTVESTLAESPAPLAQVVPLRPRCAEGPR